jgi:hypothetical protein
VGAIVLQFSLGTVGAAFCSMAHVFVAPGKLDKKLPA